MFVIGTAVHSLQHFLIWRRQSVNSTWNVYLKHLFHLEPTCLKHRKRISVMINKESFIMNKLHEHNIYTPSEKSRAMKCGDKSSFMKDPNIDSQHANIMHVNKTRLCKSHKFFAT